MTFLTKYDRPCLRSADGEQAFSDDVGDLRQVGALLDGSRDFGQVIADGLMQGLEFESVMAALAELEAHGLIMDAEPDDFTASLLSEESPLLAQARAFNVLAGGRAALRQGSPGVDAQRRLASATIAIVGEGCWAEHAETLLIRAGLGRSEKITDLTFDAEQHRHALDVVLFLPEAFAPDEARVINETCIRGGVPVVFYSHDSLRAIIGPFVLPEQSACYACLETRIAAAMPGANGRVRDGTSRHSISIPLGLDVICLDILKFVTGFATPLLANRVVTMDSWTGLQEVHPVLKMPRCPVCGLRDRPPPTLLWEVPRIGHD